MAEKSTTFPHQDLIAEHKLTTGELPEKTQKLLEKFATLTDPDAQDAMDEKLYGQIEDHIEAKAEKEKAEKVKKKVAEHKEKKKQIDVSKAATATGADDKSGQAGTPPPPAPKKSALGFLFGK